MYEYGLRNSLAIYAPSPGDAGALQMPTTKMAIRATLNVKNVCLRTWRQRQRRRRPKRPGARGTVAVDADAAVGLGGLAFETARGKRPAIEPTPAPKPYAPEEAWDGRDINGEAGTFASPDYAPAPAPAPHVAAIGVLISDGSSGGTARGEAACSAGPRFLGTVEACGGSGASARQNKHKHERLQI